MWITLWITYINGGYLDLLIGSKYCLSQKLVKDQSGKLDLSPAL
jgi:hypothetical protein